MTDEPQDTTAAPEADTPGGPPSKDARTMAMLAHLLGIVSGFLGPLIIWLIKKDDDAFIDDQGKEALNFQITLIIAYLAMFVLSCITLGFAAPLIFILFIVDIVFCIIAGMKANDGVAYRYPLTIRLIK